jgi:hypothetical protein
MLGGIVSCKILKVVFHGVEVYIIKLSGVYIVYA